MPENPESHAPMSQLMALEPEQREGRHRLKMPAAGMAEQTSFAA
jgi:hypothetical protein